MTHKIQLLDRPDNEYRTQKDWIPIFNGRKEKMISVADTADIAENNQEADLAKLHSDFKGILMSSSQLEFNTHDLGATITHDVGSEVVKPTKIVLKEVPVGRPIFLKELLELELGLAYARALTKKPKATKEQLTDTFVTLSGKKAEKIEFWTPTQSQRKDRPVRCVWLCFYDFGRFVVGADGRADGIGGLSRGVIVPSAKQTKPDRACVAVDCQEHNWRQYFKLEFGKGSSKPYLAPDGFYCTKCIKKKRDSDGRKTNS